MFEHGHDINNKNTHIQTIESFNRVNIDYAYIGHFHNYKTEDLHEIPGQFRDKNVTFIPHSNVNSNTYEDRHLWSSVPAIHFSIDSLEGKKHQENLTLVESYKLAKAKENEKIIIKIKDK